MLGNGEMVETKLQRIADKARNDSGCVFTSLFHLMNIEMMLECEVRCLLFKWLNRRGKRGV